jgi:hypothetical protein
MMIVSSKPAIAATSEVKTTTATATATATATVTTVTPPADTASSLDSRINSLQSTKNCIHGAKTKSDVDQCRQTIQIKRENVNVH